MIEIGFSKNEIEMKSLGTCNSYVCAINYGILFSECKYCELCYF